MFQHNDINIGWECLGWKNDDFSRLLERMGLENLLLVISHWTSGVGAAMGWALSRPDLVFPIKTPKKWRMVRKKGLTWSITVWHPYCITCFHMLPDYFRGGQGVFFWNNLKWDEDFGWLTWDISTAGFFFTETSEDFWTGDLKLTALWWRNIASWKSNYFSWILEEQMQ